MLHIDYMILFDEKVNFHLYVRSTVIRKGGLALYSGYDRIIMQIHS